MVNFICETCQATLRKNQIERHCQGACRDAWVFTCIDCSKEFAGYEYVSHNECITEAQKYHGKFAKPTKNSKPAVPVQPVVAEAPVKRAKVWKGWKNEIKAVLIEAGAEGVRVSKLRNLLVPKYMEMNDSEDLEGAQAMFAAKVTAT